jgi:hypothetical protein
MNEVSQLLVSERIAAPQPSAKFPHLWTGGYLDQLRHIDVMNGRVSTHIRHSDDLTRPIKALVLKARVKVMSEKLWSSPGSVDT